MFTLFFLLPFALTAVAMAMLLCSLPAMRARCEAPCTADEASDGGWMLALESELAAPTPAELIDEEWSALHAAAMVDAEWCTLHAQRIGVFNLAIDVGRRAAAIYMRPRMGARAPELNPRGLWGVGKECTSAVT